MSSKLSSAQIAQKLRAKELPIIVVVREDTVFIDVRCIQLGEEVNIVDAIIAISRGV